MQMLQQSLDDWVEMKLVLKIKKAFVFVAPSPRVPVVNHYETCSGRIIDETLECGSGKKAKKYAARQHRRANEIKLNDESTFHSHYPVINNYYQHGI